MTYNDITYCSRECANMECKRNQKHIPKDWEIVSMAGFADCENWKEVDADFMFEALEYKKGEGEKSVWYEKNINREGTIIEFDLINKELRLSSYDYALHSGEAIFLRVIELKAINKKCQELGWE